MTTEVTLIPGDGIGPEITHAALLVLEAMELDLSFDRQDAGELAFKSEGEVLPERVFSSIRRTKLALKGPITTPVGKGFRSVNVRLRKALDLFANVRPVRTLPGVASRYTDVDLVIVRENTEGEYSGIEHEVIPGVTESLKIVTHKACSRLARYAFEYARKKGLSKVAAVHKANIMKLTDGLFLDCARAAHREFSDLAYDELIVDNCAMQLVARPEQFQVLFMNNLYGDILSDLCAGLVGGLGVVPGANIGEEIAVFEPVHGSAPDIAGKGYANPTALLLSAAMMLDHMGDVESGDRLRKAIDAVLEAGAVRTRDLSGTASTVEFAQAVIGAL